MVRFGGGASSSFIRGEGWFYLFYSDQDCSRKDLLTHMLKDLHWLDVGSGIVFTVRLLEPGHLEKS